MDSSNNKELINTKINVLIEEWKTHKADTRFSYQVIAVIVIFTAFLVFATFWINTAFIYISTPAIFLALWATTGVYVARLYIFDIRCAVIEKEITKNLGEKVLDWEYTGGRFILALEKNERNRLSEELFNFQNQFYLLANIIVLIAIIIISYMGFSLIWESNTLVAILLIVLYAMGYSVMGYQNYLLFVKKSYEKPE